MSENSLSQDRLSQPFWVALDTDCLQGRCREPGNQGYGVSGEDSRWGEEERGADARTVGRGNEGRQEDVAEQELADRDRRMKAFVARRH